MLMSSSKEANKTRSTLSKVTEKLIKVFENWRNFLVPHVGN